MNTQTHRRGWLAFLAFAGAITGLPLRAKAEAAQPKLLLAQDYKPGIDVARYLVSEKLDGVRAYWDGVKLLFRSGQAIGAPAWFTDKLPKGQALDGELWLARGKFDELSGIARKTLPVDAEWQRLSYVLFELPGGAGTFAQRFEALKGIVQRANWPQLRVADQLRVANDKALKLKLAEVVDSGGEGLMLHAAAAAYTTGRSSVLLKLKPVADADARVIVHIAGKGKHQGRMGALLLRTEDGIEFKLGTGFDDATRSNPPPIGSTVTFSYRDKTPSGKPRFASFLRVRELP